MLDSLKDDLEKMRRDPAGKRFKNEHRRAEKRGLSQGLLRAAFFIAAFVSAVIGVVLVFIPGPAFVFFILSGALVAIPCWSAAKALDKAEAKACLVWGRLKARFGRNNAAHAERPRPCKRPGRQRKT